MKAEREAEKTQLSKSKYLEDLSLLFIISNGFCLHVYRASGCWGGNLPNLCYSKSAHEMKLKQKAVLKSSKAPRCVLKHFDNWDKLSTTLQYTSHITV